MKIEIEINEETITKGVEAIAASVVTQYLKDWGTANLIREKLKAAGDLIINEAVAKLLTNTTEIDKLVREEAIKRSRRRLEKLMREEPPAAVTVAFASPEGWKHEAGLLMNRIDFLFNNNPDRFWSARVNPKVYDQLPDDVQIGGCYGPTPLYRTSEVAVWALDSELVAGDIASRPSQDEAEGEVTVE